jgi:hypothetical protein
MALTNAANVELEPIWASLLAKALVRVLCGLLRFCNTDKRCRASVPLISLSNRWIPCPFAMLFVSSAFAAATLHPTGFAEALHDTFAYCPVFTTSLLHTQKDCDNSTLCVYAKDRDYAPALCMYLQLSQHIFIIF